MSVPAQAPQQSRLTEQLRKSVRKAYSAAAEEPRGEHPFPVGQHFAKTLGYPLELFAPLPSVATEAFSGVSNVSIFANIPVGATVLDLGCGAGLDSLIAARRVGPTGRVIGVDFSTAMLARAGRAALELGIKNMELYQADAEALPIKDGLIDVALVNGIFNLNPKRDAIFRELGRVVRGGGVLYAAELILREALPAETRESEADWFA
ncbi:methyltransferase domain-containing protein [Acidobacteria bacterium AH-259-A15]|nr:methyltransferase domain-containing protein [Acidobacteria bacterium AH-259-A15]